MAFDVFGADRSSGRFRFPCREHSMCKMRWASIVVARELGIDNELIQRGLSTFKSVKRRLELRGEVNGVRVYDDFAHHPTAVQETLRAVRERYPDETNLGCVRAAIANCRQAGLRTGVH